MKGKNILTFLFILTISCISFSTTVDATVYGNNNGIVVSEEAYETIVNMYGQSYFDEMTQEQYSFIEELFVEGNTIEMSTYVENTNMMRNLIYQTGSKRLAIAKSCNSFKCTVVTALTWLGEPVVTSYDVIGARFNNASLANSNILTRIQSDDGISYSDNLKQYSNGFGVSVKLPDHGTNIIVDQRFYMEPQGTVFASYQHADEDVTLATSKKYTLSNGCYGNVFCFYGAASDKYDQMHGVYVTL